MGLVRIVGFLGLEFGVGELCGGGRGEWSGDLIRLLATFRGHGVLLVVLQFCAIQGGKTSPRNLRSCGCEASLGLLGHFVEVCVHQATGVASARGASGHPDRKGATVYRGLARSHGLGLAEHIIDEARALNLLMVTVLTLTTRKIKRNIIISITITIVAIVSSKHQQTELQQ